MTHMDGVSAPGRNCRDVGRLRGAESRTSISHRHLPPHDTVRPVQQHDRFWMFFTSLLHLVGYDLFYLDF